METYNISYDNDKIGKEIGDLLLKKGVVGGRFHGFDSESVKRLHDTEKDFSENHVNGKRHFRHYTTIYHIGDSSVKIDIEYELSKTHPFSKPSKITSGHTSIHINAQTQEKVEESRSLLEKMAGIKIRK